MIEKERPLSPQPHYSRDFDTNTGDEISLLDILETLIRKKILILSITSIFTLVAILYVIFFTPSPAPIYRTTIGFLPPPEAHYLASLPPNIASSLPGGGVLNVRDEAVGTNNSVFAQFLVTIGSYSLKKEVFEAGDFLKKFIGDTHSANPDSVLLGIHESLKITKKDVPAYIEIQGTQPEMLAEFLTALTKSAMQRTITDIRGQAELHIKNKTTSLIREISALRAQAKKIRKNKIIVLSGALDIARNLGIKNNNFSKFAGVSDPIVWDNKKALINMGQQLPLWFLYGEKALSLEIQALKSRVSDDTVINDLTAKETELQEYQSIDISTITPLVATIIQPAISQTIQPIRSSKIKIVIIGMVSGLFIGILMAFLSNALACLRKRQLTIK